MAAMIWDTEAQAFTEAETPLKYDPIAGAWTETTGMAYNQDAAAWEEKWRAKKGIEITSQEVELYNPNNASVVWNTSSGIYLQQNSDGNVGGCNAQVITKDYIDISNYAKIIMSGRLYVAYSNTSGYNPKIYLLDKNGNSKQIYIYSDIFTGTRTFDDVEIDISSITGEFRIGLMTYVYNGFNSGTYIDCTKYLLTN